MERRKFIAGGCAVSLVAGAGLTTADEGVTYEKNDKYWETQWLIGELEQENEELRTHARIMSKRA